MRPFNAMDAKSLNCPNCGAATSTETSRCAHCNSRLATIACPSCFGMVFLGAKFCSHCGGKVDRREALAKAHIPCPRCRTETNHVVIGKTDLRECPRCEGLWADTEAMQQICTDQEQQAAILGVAAPLPTILNQPLEPIRYVPCPMCRQLMHRVNFARCSQVIVDVCKLHGTWFDKDELRRIVEFIRHGGFDKVRALDLSELDRKRRALLEAQADAYQRDVHPYPRDSREGAIAAVFSAVVGSIFD